VAFTVGDHRSVLWADNGSYDVLDYRPQFGLDTALIHHLAGLVPRFRQALERAAH